MSPSILDQAQGVGHFPQKAKLGPSGKGTPRGVWSGMLVSQRDGIPEMADKEDWASPGYSPRASRLMAGWGH